MFYKALGFVVWRLAVKYIRRNYGRQIRLAMIAGVASILAAGYLASRSGGE